MKIRRSSILKFCSFPVLTGFILAIFLLTFSVNIYAASGNSSDSYPFNIAVKYTDSNSGNTINSLYFDYLINDKATLIEHINSDLTTQNVSFDSYLVFISDISNRTTNLHGAQPHIQITYTILTNPIINSNITQTDSFLSVICPITYTNSVNYRQTYTPSTSVNAYQYRASYNGGTFNSLGSLSFINYTPFIENTYLGTGYYNANYPIISYNIGDGILSSNDSLCIIDQEIPSFPVISTGHAIAPGFNNLSPGYLTGHNAPSNVPPIITVNNYTWTTAPTPDFSTLENGIESLGDYIVWLSSNIHGEFSNLVDNLSDLISFIGDTIQYYGNLIIANIQNGISNLYDNLESLFVPIAENVYRVGLVFASIIALGTDPSTDMFSIPYLTHVMLVPDTTNVVELFIQHDDFHLITIGQNLVTMSLTIYNSIVAITPSGVIHVPSCYYHGQQIGNFDIDFSWFNQYKSYSDILLSGFLIFGYFYWLYITFASHIKGVFMPDVTPEDDSYSRHHIGF